MEDDNNQHASNKVEMESYDPMPSPTLHAFEPNDESAHSTNPHSIIESDQKLNGKNTNENQAEKSDENPENTADSKNPDEATPPAPRSYPIFLGIVTLVDIIMLAVSIIINKGIEPLKDNPMIGPSGKVLDELGARVVSEILDGQYWRLISAMFLHVGAVHLILNLIFQLKTGVALEQSIGTIKMAIIYLLCGIAGNISSGIFLPQLLSVGASGALFGLVGVLCAINMKSWKVIKHQPTQKKNLAFTLAGLIINFIIGLLPMIDNFCHLGGFIVGILCGFVMMPAAVITQQKTDEQEGEFYLSYKSKENYVYITIGLLGLIAYFVTGLVILFDRIQPEEWCSWCADVDCPTTWSICDGYH